MRLAASAFQALMANRLEELSGRLSQLETAGASGSVPSVLGQSATSFSGATACARAGALLGGGAHPGGTRGQMHCQTSAPHVKPLTSQPDRLNEATSLSGALLRIANALEQKHGSPGTVHDAFGLNPAIANKEYDAIFRDQSSREAFGASRLGGQALIARVERTRKDRPEVHERRVRRDLSALGGEAWSSRRHADVCLLPRCGNFHSLKRFVAMTAAALDEGRSGNLQRQNALPHHIYVVLESASQDPSHEMEWGWAILGIQDPEGPCLAPWAPAEQSVHKRRLGCSAQEHGCFRSDLLRLKRAEPCPYHK